MTETETTDETLTDTEPDWHREQRKAGTLNPPPSAWTECSWCAHAWLSDQS